MQNACNVTCISACVLQGATPKDLATQFQKQDCIDFLASAENEVEIFGHENTGNLHSQPPWHESFVSL